MTTTPSILQDGKLKPGIYKIQNLQTGTWVDIEEQSRAVCCRPAQNIEEGNGLWEIQLLGAGYSVKRVEPGKPDQFCMVMDKVELAALSVAAYPVAWRVEIVDNVKHRGFEYVRFCWGITDWSWAVSYGSKENGAPVVTWTHADRESQTGLMWKLIPVEAPETMRQEPPPLYEGDTTGPARTQHTDYERDDFGTIVTEVITTRRRYRVGNV